MISLRGDLHLQANVFWGSEFLLTTSSSQHKDRLYKEYTFHLEI